ncbi:hypothetical protein [Vitiosangium sp. GDMCC 1.1324]|uniref:hypothetical protein n=1 Tax=Vitiosangium sp. (strain GDMCC 1.1324) TaxID=2138576 RepID=UPI000D3D1CB6|nr:hypothetical protein [Vitiosangium sp. GDMCC 1.1324]PTL85334.1 hypothetical protein DAT35_01015 [Vitiosangium sp. GDMCC 1.1324]
MLPIAGCHNSPRMLAHSVVNGTRTWTTPNGELRLWQPAPHVIVTRFKGSMYDAHLAHLAMVSIEGILSSSPSKVDIFHDWEEMELYATEARTIMTERAVPLGPKINSLSVLFGSKVVLMGVSLASLKLGGIHTFTGRDEFEQVIRQASESRPGTYKPTLHG